jgi:hypothetical protein
MGVGGGWRVGEGVAVGENVGVAEGTALGEGVGLGVERAAERERSSPAPTAAQPATSPARRTMRTSCLMAVSQQRLGGEDSRISARRAVYFSRGRPLH